MSQEKQLTETTMTQSRQNSAKALKLKIKGVESHLESIIQKKLRLDLEIRSTAKRLTNLRNKSKELTKNIKPKLESAGSIARLRLLSEASTEDLELLLLSQAEDSASELLEVVTELEPVLYKNTL